MNTTKTILVTGAVGHIGSRLIRSFDPEKVKKVILLDNLESQRYPSLFDLPKSIKYEFLEADVRTCDFEKILAGVDALIHLAAITNAEASFDKAKEVEEVNFEGLKRAADACLKMNVKLFFPSSTSVIKLLKLLLQKSRTTDKSTLSLHLVTLQKTYQSYWLTQFRR